MTNVQTSGSLIIIDDPDQALADDVFHEMLTEDGGAEASARRMAVPFHFSHNGVKYQIAPHSRSGSFTVITQEDPT